jgi:hypothetical protein
MSVTLRFTGPPSPGYADDGETWQEDLGTDVWYPLHRRVKSGEAVTLDGDDWRVVKQDPEDPTANQPDAILLDTPSGQRVALPRTLWSADGEPGNTVGEVLERVGDDVERARTELMIERAKGSGARKTLVEKLEQIAGPMEEPEQPADTTGGE